SSLLESDPQAAQDFARFAQADVAIEQYFASARKSATLESVDNVIRGKLQKTHEPVPFPSTGRIAAWAAVAAVFVAMLVVWMLREPNSAPENPSLAAVWKLPEAPSVPGAKRIRSAEGLSRAEKRAVMRLHARLSRYYLPSVEFQNLPLDAALAEIEKLMEKSDYRGWLKDEPLSLTIAKSDSVSKGRSFSLSRTNLSASDALELLAIQAGKSLVFHPSGVELVDFSEDPDAPLFTRTFKVESGKYYRRSPYIQPQLAKIEIIREFVYPAEFEPPEIPQDNGLDLTDKRVSASQIDYPIFGSDSPEGQLEIWGITSEDVSIAFHGSDNTDLVVTARQDTMDRIATLIEAVGSESSDGAMVRVEAMIFEVPEAMATQDALVASADLGSLLDELDGSATRVDYPGVMTRNARRVEIQSVVEQAFETSAGETFTDRRGSVLQVNPTFDGELIQITGSADQGFIPEEPDLPLSADATRIHPESPIVHHTVDFDAHLGPGEAALFSMPGTAPGKVLIYVIEANRN
ncbi:MAG: hypothetical protein KDN22_30530, partial [Verrucomicrobiae bacterium]|nr:hypothetical protein [Verrucomicrobiae bacterium]